MRLISKLGKYRDAHYIHSLVISSPKNLLWNRLFYPLQLQILGRVIHQIDTSIRYKAFYASYTLYGYFL